MTFSPQARARLGTLTEARTKWDHVHALVEQASARGSGAFGGGGARRRLASSVKQIGRAATDVAELLAAHGFGQLAEDVRELTQAARKGEAIPRAALHRTQEVVAGVAQGLQAAEAAERREDAEEEADG